MRSRQLTLSISILAGLYACSSQPLSPEDELAMMLYRDCMNSAPRAVEATDVNHAVSSSSGSINSNAQSIRDGRSAKDCRDLVHERDN